MNYCGLDQIFSQQFIIVGDMSESESVSFSDPRYIKKVVVSYEEASKYALEAGCLYIEASRESGLNMTDVA
jgi:hypothetical protein